MPRYVLAATTLLLCGVADAQTPSPQQPVYAAPQQPTYAPAPVQVQLVLEQPCLLDRCLGRLGEILVARGQPRYRLQHVAVQQVLQPTMVLAPTPQASCQAPPVPYKGIPQQYAAPQARPIPANETPVPPAPPVRGS